jgi:hypothetical protein
VYIIEGQKTISRYCSFKGPTVQPDNGFPPLKNVQ